jgi:type VII secretion protein EccB
VPRGEPLGIIGAPDGLPSLAADPWQVCTAAEQGKPGGAAVRVGDTDAQPLGDDEAVVGVAPGAGTFLLWRGKRHRVDTDRGALDALAGVPQQVQVPTTVVDAFPSGPDFGPQRIDGLGGEGPDLGGTPSKLGMLYTVAGDRAQQYVLTKAGFKPLSEVDARLLAADPEIRRGAYGGGNVTVAEVSGRAVSEHLAPGGPPAPVRPPRAVSPHAGQGLCALVTPDGAVPRTQVALSDRFVPAGQPPAAQPGIAAPCAAADRIAVRPGSGALVRPAAASGRAGDTPYLVTDTGVKYPVPPAGAKALGLPADAARGMSASVLNLLPTGAALDPAVLARGGTVLSPAAGCRS